MSIPQGRKRIVVGPHNAYQFENKIGPDNRPSWIIKAAEERRIRFFRLKDGSCFLIVDISGGTQAAELGDWIMQTGDDLQVLNPIDFDRFFVFEGAS